MTIAIIAGVCVLLLILAFLAPRLSRRPEHGVHEALGTGGRAAGSAPGPLGRWLRKPLSSSSRLAGRSAWTGRRARRKMPL